jgi:hypothetical protein
MSGARGSRRGFPALIGNDAAVEHANAPIVPVALISISLSAGGRANTSVKCAARGEELDQPWRIRLRANAAFPEKASLWNSYAKARRVVSKHYGRQAYVVGAWGAR